MAQRGHRECHGRSLSFVMSVGHGSWGSWGGGTEFVGLRNGGGVLGLGLESRGQRAEAKKSARNPPGGLGPPGENPSHRNVT